MNFRPQLILMDVYDTILKMDEVERRVNEMLSSRLAYTVWYEVFMQYCFVDNCIDRFNDFASIAAATLQMTAKRLKKDLSEREIKEVLDLLKYLPIREGVQDGLSALNDLGIRIAALTNSPEAIVVERMERTGLASYFEKILSAEHVRKYKPSLEVYNWAARQLNTGVNNILLVSKHGWDIAGAHNAGMRTAYVNNTAEVFYPLAPKPDFIARDLEKLADQFADKNH